MLAPVLADRRTAARDDVAIPVRALAEGHRNREPAWDAHPHHGRRIFAARASALVPQKDVQRDVSLAGDACHEAVQDRCEETEDPSREQLRAHFAGIRRLARTDPDLFVVMGELAMRGRRDRAIAAIVRDVDVAWEKTLAALLRHAAKEGAIAKPAKPDELAGLIVATLKGLFMLSGDDREPKAVDRQLRALERLIA